MDKVTNFIQKMTECFSHLEREKSRSPSRAFQWEKEIVGNAPPPSMDYERLREDARDNSGSVQETPRAIRSSSIIYHMLIPSCFDYSCIRGGIQPIQSGDSRLLKTGGAPAAKFTRAV
jgi:hypothetical protein